MSKNNSQKTEYIKLTREDLERFLAVAKNLNDGINKSSLNHFASGHKNAKNVSPGSKIVADLSGVDLSGITFENVDISGAKFKKCKLENTTFKDVLMDKADFRKAKIKSSEFDKCNLEGTRLSKAKIEKCKFDECDMKLVNMEEARVKSSEFKNLDMSASKLSFIDASREGEDKPNSFIRVNLEKASAYKGNFSDCSFFQGKHNAANFSYANFSNARVKKCDLSSTDFRRANFYRAELGGDGTTVNKTTNFKEANMLLVKDASLSTTSSGWFGRKTKSKTSLKELVERSNSGANDSYASKAYSNKYTQSILPAAMELTTLFAEMKTEYDNFDKNEHKPKTKIDKENTQAIKQILRSQLMKDLLGERKILNLVGKIKEGLANVEELDKDAKYVIANNSEAQEKALEESFKILYKIIKDPELLEACKYLEKNSDSGLDALEEVLLGKAEKVGLNKKLLGALRKGGLEAVAIAIPALNEMLEEYKPEEIKESLKSMKPVFNGSRKWHELDSKELINGAASCLDIIAKSANNKKIQEGLREIVKKDLLTTDELKKYITSFDIEKSSIDSINQFLNKDTLTVAANSIPILGKTALTLANNKGKFNEIKELKDKLYPLPPSVEVIDVIVNLMDDKSIDGTSLAQSLDSMMKESQGELVAISQKILSGQKLGGRNISENEALSLVTIGQSLVKIVGSSANLAKAGSHILRFEEANKELTELTNELKERKKQGVEFIKETEKLLENKENNLGVSEKEQLKNQLSMTIEGVENITNFLENKDNNLIVSQKKQNQLKDKRNQAIRGIVEFGSKLNKEGIKDFTKCLSDNSENIKSLAKSALANENITEKMIDEMTEPGLRLINNATGPVLDILKDVKQESVVELVNGLETPSGSSGVTEMFRKIDVLGKFLADNQEFSKNLKTKFPELIKNNEKDIEFLAKTFLNSEAGKETNISISSGLKLIAKHEKRFQGISEHYHKGNYVRALLSCVDVIVSYRAVHFAVSTIGKTVKNKLASGDSKQPEKKSFAKKVEEEKNKPKPPLAK
ncbi:MAG TPA: pentapeptide repeat-containing protein [Candidatus Megaira endosymbiont of Nemacystus decipiens]|nr:pentapeptide repeat-containing protein [Candidatus Megaera endosymbiont of Nemacystus decipiens]